MTRGEIDSLIEELVRDFGVSREKATAVVYKNAGKKPPKDKQAAKPKEKDKKVAKSYREHTIYLLTSKLNGMKYVGIAYRWRFSERMKEHKKANANGDGTNTFLYDYVKARYSEGYKWKDIFDVSVLEEFDEDRKSCEYLESYFIHKHNSLAPNGFNIKQVEFFRGESKELDSWVVVGQVIRTKFEYARVVGFA